VLEDLTQHLDPVLSSCLDTHRPFLAVAVSGGSDSMALALLLHDWCKKRKGRILALSVDHGLRPESTSECVEVARWMRAHRIEHRILRILAMPPGGNLQARARDARYEALIRACKREHAEALCVAHHAEDQAETVMLQRHRGPSPVSSSGMPLIMWREDVKVVRPLLGVRKSLLRAYLLSRNQRWVEDPSNLSERYARNRLRHMMNEKDICRLWREAQHMGEVRHEEDVRRNRWLEDNAELTRLGSVIFAAEPWRALELDERTDLLSRAIQHQGGKRYRPRHRDTARLDRRIMEQEHGKATLGHTVILWSREDNIRIMPEPARKALDSVAKPPHMRGGNLPKSLEAPPFWWFNFEPLF
jgi:tRNA(Ile)-lysidine synthase